MRAYELLTSIRNGLELMEQNHICPGDVHYLELYSTYRRRFAQGEKVTYMAADLAKKHNINERTFYEIKKRMEKEIRTDI